MMDPIGDSFTGRFFNRTRDVAATVVWMADECHTCSGTGKCHHCHGLGVFDEGGEGPLGEPSWECSRGECVTCNGRGVNLEIWRRGRQFRVNDQWVLGLYGGLLLLLIGGINVVLMTLGDPRMLLPIPIALTVGLFAIAVPLVFWGVRQRAAWKAVKEAGAILPLV